MSQIEKSFADEFAQDWIASWNAHDLDRILSHYADDFEMTSPAIIQVAGEPSGTLKGKEAVGNYWRKGLALIPDLHFDWIATTVGVNSIAIHYKGASERLAIEVFHFDPNEKVRRAFAHYA